MQRKNNIVLRLHRQRKPEQVLLPLVREDNGEALRVILEKQDNVTAEFIYRTEKKVRSGWLKLEIEQDGCRRSDNLEEELPVILEVETDIRPEAMTAMYLLNDWWTRPAFINDFSEIPELTQAIYGKLRNGYFFLLPMPGKQFKTQVKPGRENTLIFGMSACKGGISKLDEPVYAYAEADSLQEAVHACMAWAAEYHGIRLKEERNMPEMLKYLGWCSWDAFYTEISEEKVRAKGREFAEKNVPVRWMLMDDGWLSVHGDALYDLAPEKEKFPNGFAQMIRDIKRDTQVDWFGVWHALGGYWGGIEPGSDLAAKEQEHLYQNAPGKLIPWPDAAKGYGFYRDWYEYLKREGISFSKVDGQSAVHNYFENDLPLMTATRGMHGALEGAAAYFDGAVINCMGMAAENMFSRPQTAVARNSDDFIPKREDGFAEHLLQNAYNTPYQGELYVCDWDMFWTSHEDGLRHSLLRAISGGPVYFSDRIGETAPEVAAPLCYADGRLPQLLRAARPTQDCMFRDPRKDGVLKLTNAGAYANGKIGGVIAVYNLTHQEQTYRIGASDIPELSGKNCWIYDCRNQTAAACSAEEGREYRLAAGDFTWFLFVEDTEGKTFVGLVDKYISFDAVLWMHEIGGRLMGEICGGKTVGFLSKEPVKRVLCNGEDVTAQVEKKDCLYLLELNGQNAVVEVE